MLKNISKNPSLRVLKALSHPTRLEILRSVAGRKEVTGQELSKKFNLSQPTMSHHFNKLVRAGVLINRKQGTFWFYSVNLAYIAALGIHLEKLLTHS